jgi:hypothetical protein
MCPRESFTRKKEAMSNSLFDSIIVKAKNKIPSIRYLTISGFGEFATDPGWRDKIEKGASAFERLHVITNCSLFDTSDLDFLLAHVTDVRVSVYGTDEESYVNVHRPPSGATYSSVEKNIRYLREHKSPKQRIVLNYIEVRENASKTGEWIDRWEGYVDLLEVWKPHNWIRGKEYRTPCAHRLQTCGRPYNGPVQVQVDGTVNLCCFDYNGELVIGDLNTEGFTEIFEGNRMIRYQHLHETGSADAIPQCRVCDQRDCNPCKSVNVVYNSGFDTLERVGRTSTEYEDVSAEKR